MKTAVYLDFMHNAKEVIDTYRDVFGAEIVCQYFFDENMTKDQELLGKVFHAELKIGDLNLYLADSGKEPSFPFIKFVVELREEVEARQCFEKLIQNGKVISNFTKMPYGPTIAEAEDKFGIKWDIVIC